MKKTITLFATILLLQAKAQTTTSDFETFTLSLNSAYSSTASVPFETSNASFQYKWDTQFSMWSGGFAYTNKYDSATAGFGNLYGVKPLKGYNASSVYVVSQNNSMLKLKSPANSLNGFYITNTTYAYKSMKNGDQFAKKFGGVSGNDADWFKVLVRGYLGGTLKTDSVEFYLADFRSANNAQDYIVSTWQWVNTAALGQVDSVKFTLKSSDVGQFGMNTPAFFGIDNLTTNVVVGIDENEQLENVVLAPNPANEKLILTDASVNNGEIIIGIYDMSGKNVLMARGTGRIEMDLSALSNGIYMVNIETAKGISHKKLIKN